MASSSAGVWGRWSTTRHNGRCPPVDLHRVQVFQVTLQGTAGDPQATGDLPLRDALRKQTAELGIINGVGHDDSSSRDHGCSCWSRAPVSFHSRPQLS
jgi:hypothetical protein